MAYGNYVKQGAPFIDHATDPAATFAAADANGIDDGVFNAFYMPAVRVMHNAAQSIANATDTTLAFNTEIFDQAGNAADTMHDNVTNNSRLTARYAGIYEIKLNIEWAGNATGERYISFRINGSTIIAAERRSPVSTPATVHVLSTLWSMAVNDYVEARVFQNSGGALNVNSFGSQTPVFSMHRVG